MNQSFDTISIIGLGYIGLPTAAVFASRKIKVVGVDVNEYAVETINQGRIHIVEPDLDMVVHAAVTEGYLRATTRPERQRLSRVAPTGITIRTSATSNRLADRLRRCSKRGTSSFSSRPRRLVPPSKCRLGWHRNGPT